MKPAYIDEPLTPAERFRGAAFMAMLRAYRAAGRIDELAHLTGRQLVERAIQEGYVR